MWSPGGCRRAIFVNPPREDTKTVTLLPTRAANETLFERVEVEAGIVTGSLGRITQRWRPWHFEVQRGSSALPHQHLPIDQTALSSVAVEDQRVVERWRETEGYHGPTADSLGNHATCIPAVSAVRWAPEPARDDDLLAHREQLSDSDAGDLSLQGRPMRLQRVGAHIVLENAGVSLGGHRVLRGLNFSVAPGEVLGVAGPNGSGKTTLLRLLATLVRPDEGGGRVLEAALGTAEVYAIRSEIGLVGHVPTVIGELSLRENLEHATRLRGEDLSRIEPALRVVGLDEAADRKVEASSYGMLRRIEAARLLITEPRLLLLDEAFSGLDVDAQELMDALIVRTIGNGGSVVMVSHDAAHLGRRAGRVMSLSAGRLETVP